MHRFKQLLALPMLATAIWLLWVLVQLLQPTTFEVHTGYEAYSATRLELLRAEGKPVLVDATADWCISCKEMEAITFANPEIAKEMGRFVLVQADVTVNNPSSQALLKQYGLFGQC